jgi:hypothetical protein
MKRARLIMALLSPSRKPKLQSAAQFKTTLAAEVQLHCLMCGRHDGLPPGTWAACDLILPVWSQYEIDLYMTPAFMQTLLAGMKAYLAQDHNAEV